MTSINVSKKSVKELLITGSENKFVVPEYQRPYAWTDEHIQTLFDDLTEYTQNNHGETKDSSTYFLGSIVSFKNENEEQEIIDGQQRITTLSLLLRAIHAKLTTMESTPKNENITNKINAALWEVDPLTGEPDFKKTLIFSRVMSEKGNKTFTDILTTGRTVEGAQDNYTKNYKQLSTLVDEYAAKEPELFFWFINNLLEKVIVLPIEADTQDTALTIFSTLNDRGLALSDSDIFKAKIYNHLDDDKKQIFIEKWQSLDEDARNANEDMQKLFYYYMFYLRAKDGDRKTATSGMRKYFSKDGFTRLFDENLLDDLRTILNLWEVVNTREPLEDEPWSSNKEIRKTLDSLSFYPNEFWKYPVVTYYIQYNKRSDFEENFLIFLRQLLATLLAKYIVSPTINSVKGAIMNLSAEVIKTPTPEFNFGNVGEKELDDKIQKAHSKTVRMILSILAYEKQTELLPSDWEIEHILPQKWQDNFFPRNNDAEVKELVEHIGNKLPVEKKVNITASNGYFKKKKESYKKSNIEIVRNLAASEDDWDLKEIRKRDYKVAEELIRILKEWGLNKSYTDNSTNGAETI